MKKYLCLIFILGLFFNAQAQVPGFGGTSNNTITGRIVAIVSDSLTKQAVDHASVSLVNTNGKTINGGLTDAKGKVVIQNVAIGDYRLMVGFIGYKTKTISIKTTPEKPDINVGNILLLATQNTLQEVEVTGKKSIVENKIDRMVYNAEADATNAGGDATDVMRKVPMLSVDADGNLQLRGGAVRVLINGKPSGSMSSSVADALKMIPAEQIKSVEVITSPSAKYDAEGSSGIINIITKKSNTQGISGSVNASAGTRQNNGAFNLTAKTGRLSINSSIGGNSAYPQHSAVNVVNKYFTNGILTNQIEQHGYSEWSRNSLNGSVGIDYDLNAYNNFNSNIKFNRFQNGGPGQADYSINQLYQHSMSDQDMIFNNMDWNVGYKKTTKKEGEEFSVAGQITRGRTPSYFSNTINDIKTEANNTGKNNEYTLQVDYTYPFSKATSLELGAKGIVREINSQFDLASRDFKYNQDVIATYGIFAFNLTKKIQLKSGLRAEKTQINWISADNTSTKNNYFNLFPSIILSQNLKGGTTVKLSYNRRIQRPSLTYLNPFRNNVNPFYISQGNPLLAPELSDNFELGYSTYIKGSVINASIFYKRTHDIIESIISGIIDNGTNKSFNSYTNVGALESYGFNLFGSYNPKPKWTLMGNVGLNTYEIKNSSNNINTSTLLNYTAFARSAYRFGSGINFELFGVVNSPRRTFQGKTEAMVFYGGALKKEIMKKKGSIGINVLNPFNNLLNIRTTTEASNVYQFTDIYYPLRSFGINFSYSFGKLKFTEKKKITNDDTKQQENQNGIGG